MHWKLTACLGFGNGDHSLSLYFHVLYSFLNGCCIQFLLKVEGVQRDLLLNHLQRKIYSLDHLPNSPSHTSLLQSKKKKEANITWSHWSVYQVKNNQHSCLYAWLDTNIWIWLWDAIECLNTDTANQKKLKWTGYSTPFIMCSLLDYTDQMDREKNTAYEYGCFANVTSWFLCCFMILNSSVVQVSTLEMTHFYNTLHI